MKRRRLLKVLALAGAAPPQLAVADSARPSPEDLRRIGNAPVIDTSLLRQPVIIESMELLRKGDATLVRTRTKDGIEVISVPHQNRMPLAMPLWKEAVPDFIRGRDAREIESVMWDFYRNNYKLQGLLLWITAAAMEAALLEVLCRAANKPLAFWFGGAVRRDIPIYVASSNRGNTPAEEIRHLRKLVEESGAKALKFRLGARMSRNADHPAKRSETLISLTRETFGPDFTLYADANSSYSNPAEAIRIGA